MIQNSEKEIYGLSLEKNYETIDTYYGYRDDTVDGSAEESSEEGEEEQDRYTRPVESLSEKDKGPTIDDYSEDDLEEDALPEEEQYIHYSQQIRDGFSYDRYGRELSVSESTFYSADDIVLLGEYQSLREEERQIITRSFDERGQLARSRKTLYGVDSEGVYEKDTEEAYYSEYDGLGQAGYQVTSIMSAGSEEVREQRKETLLYDIFGRTLERISRQGSIDHDLKIIQTRYGYVGAGNDALTKTLNRQSYLPYLIANYQTDLSFGAFEDWPVSVEEIALDYSQYGEELSRENQKMIYMTEERDGNLYRSGENQSLTETTTLLEKDLYGRMLKQKKSTVEYINGQNREMIQLSDRVYNPYGHVVFQQETEYDALQPETERRVQKIWNGGTFRRGNFSSRVEYTSLRGDEDLVLQDRQLDDRGRVQYEDILRYTSEGEPLLFEGENIALLTADQWDVFENGWNDLYQGDVSEKDLGGQLLTRDVSYKWRDLHGNETQSVQTVYRGLPEGGLTRVSAQVEFQEYDALNRSVGRDKYRYLPLVETSIDFSNLLSLAQNHRDTVSRSETLQIEELSDDQVMLVGR